MEQCEVCCVLFLSSEKQRSIKVDLQRKVFFPVHESTAASQPRLPPELLEKISEYTTAKSVLCGDIRHWFHQIRIHDEISRYLCVGMGETFW